MHLCGFTLVFSVQSKGFAYLSISLWLHEKYLLRKTLADTRSDCNQSGRADRETVTLRDSFDVYLIDEMILYPPNPRPSMSSRFTDETIALTNFYASKDSVPPLVNPPRRHYHRLDREHTKTDQSQNSAYIW